MTEQCLNVLKFINENKNIKQISQILNISEKQVYIIIKRLITYGYNIEPSYSYNSDIFYKLKKEIHDLDKNKVSVKMPHEENIFRCLVISDLHIGATDSDIKLVDRVYEYAIKNGINLILNCGDSIEGDYTSDKKNIVDVFSQLEYFIKKYPYDKNITNFMIFGNHDRYSLTHNGLDISKTIKNSRYDIVPIGYGQGYVNVKKDNIILFHKLRDGFKPIINGEKIILSGHGHMMKTKLKDVFWLGIPTLSYKSNDKTQDVIPGFVDLSVHMEDEKFEYAESKHLIINPSIVQVSEVRGRVKTLFNNKWK